MSATLVMSSTQFKSVEGCLRAMLFRFRSRLRTVTSTDYFARGCAVHAGLATHYDGKSVDDSLLAAVNELQARLPNNPDMVQELTPQVLDLLTFYLSDDPKSGATLDKEERVNTIAVENTFDIEVAPDIRIIGIIDHLKYFHRSNSMKGKAIEDHKTSKRGGLTYGSNIEYEPQQLLYAWAAREMGFAPEWFSWNVLVTTKQPYVMRFYEPIYWPRIHTYMLRAINFAKWLQKQPEEPGEILLDVPGNPGQCRSCMFRQLCDFPQLTDVLLQSDFRREEYQGLSQFRKATNGTQGSNDTSSNTP